MFLVQLLAYEEMKGKEEIKMNFKMMKWMKNILRACYSCRYGLEQIYFLKFTSWVQASLLASLTCK